MSASEIILLYEQIEEQYVIIRELNSRVDDLKRKQAELQKAEPLLFKTVGSLPVSRQTLAICNRFGLYNVYHVQRCIDKGIWPKGIGVKTQAELIRVIGELLS